MNKAGEIMEKRRGDAIVIMLATVFFFGYFPYAPGTAGALPGLAISVLMLYLKTPPAIYAVIVLVMIIASIPISTRAEKLFGVKDCRHIVLDEMVSVPITLFLIPLRPHFIMTAFVLNRLADIVKPPPAHQSQRLPGGWGIILDDVIAGIYANLAMQALVFILPR
jgi:phosphatidylglycerophosphatase A